MHRRTYLALLLYALAHLAAARTTSASDPLPSWNNGPAKTAIVEFVARVTDEDGPGFVAPRDRIATFDNDGTLWAERPIYFQLLFAFDRIDALAAEHPEWRTTEPFRSVLADDLEGAMAGGHAALAEILAASHAHLTAEEFAAAVREWLATARHPETGRPYDEMVYQPMLELLDHLRENGFKTFIVSGGGIDFMRVFAEEVYGIPPEQVIGSQLDARLEMRDGVPTIVKTGELSFIDDGAGKPVGIHRHIGRRPIFAAGNSDGDLEMLQYATIRPDGDPLAAAGLLVHHTDAEREWAYDRDSPVGRLDEALDEAEARGWIVVDMRRDWAAVHPQ